MTERLSGEKIGVYFGTFAPLHTGHQQQIYKTAALNDKVLLIASGYDQDRGAQIGLHLEKRFRYLREAFSDEPTIKVVKLDENDLPEMPKGWDEWTARVLSLLTDYQLAPSGNQITFYVGEADYVRELTKRFPKADGNDYQVEIADRHDIQLSATMIRENPQNYWMDINRVFRRHFSKVVTIMGSSSTGKTTLVRRLARSINAPFSEDYRKRYSKDYNVTDQEMGLEDYTRLLTGQYDANSREINSPANQGIVFLDTDAVVLSVYSKLYLSEREQAALLPLVKKTLADEHMDLILVIPPHKASASEWDRVFHETLIQNLKAFGLMDKVVMLDDASDSRDKAGYLARYHHAIDAVKDKTGITIKRLEY